MLLNGILLFWGTGALHAPRGAHTGTPPSRVQKVLCRGQPEGLTFMESMLCTRIGKRKPVPAGGNDDAS